MTNYTLPKTISRNPTNRPNGTTASTPAGFEKAAQSFACNPSLPGNPVPADRVPQTRFLASHFVHNAKKAETAAQKKKFARFYPTFPLFPPSPPFPPFLEKTPIKCAILKT